MSDVIVIGGGHNGLIAATALARGGRSVLLVERSAQHGGVARGEEFHPGYSHDGLLHDTSTLAPEALAGLCDVPTQRASDWFVPHDAGLVLPPGLPSGGELASTGDAEAWANLFGFIGRIAPLARGLLTKPALPFSVEAPPMWGAATTGLKLRRLGKRDMHELLRVAPQAIRDWLQEDFTDERVKAALCWPGLVGTWAGPWSPQTSTTFLHWAVLNQGTEVVGGGAGLTRALEAAALSAGVEIRTEAAVERIIVRHGRAHGVVVGGEELEAAVVLSTVGPKRTLLDLVPPRDLPPQTAAAITRIRSRGILAKVHLALSAPLEHSERGTNTPAVWRVAAHPNDWERAFDHVKYKAVPTEPVACEIRRCSVLDASLAPSGHESISVMVQGAPTHTAADWSDGEREGLIHAVLSSLQRFDPHLRDKVVGHEVVTPVDVEARLGLSGGHLLHGELALDQLYFLRPTRGTAQHTTPIAGLFLGGSGTHPGGGLNGLPGRLSAERVLGR